MKDSSHYTTQESVLELKDIPFFKILLNGYLYNVKQSRDNKYLLLEKIQQTPNSTPIYKVRFELGKYQTSFSGKYIARCRCSHQELYALYPQETNYDMPDYYKVIRYELKEKFSWKSGKKLVWDPMERWLYRRIQDEIR